MIDTDIGVDPVLVMMFSQRTNSALFGHEDLARDLAD